MGFFSFLSPSPSNKNIGQECGNSFGQNDHCQQAHISNQPYDTTCGSPGDASAYNSDTCGIQSQADRDHVAIPASCGPIDADSNVLKQCIIEVTNKTCTNPHYLGFTYGHGKALSCPANSTTDTGCSLVDVAIPDTGTAVKVGTETSWVCN